MDARYSSLDLKSDVAAELLAGTPAPGSRFPSPVSPKAGAMPAHHGIGFDDLQGVEKFRRQRLKPSKHHPVDAGESDSLR